MATCPSISWAPGLVLLLQQYVMYCLMIQISLWTAPDFIPNLAFTGDPNPRENSALHSRDRMASSVTVSFLQFDTILQKPMYLY